MANLPVAFAELIVGGVLTLTGISQSGSISDVLKGDFALGLGSLTSNSTSTSSVSSGATTSTGSAPNVVGQVQKQDLGPIAASHGWSLSDVEDWMKLIDKESSGNPKAINPSSGAAGIAQFINGFSEYAQYGGNANTVNGQLISMGNYIKQRYGTPSAAWAHEVQYNWY